MMQAISPISATSAAPSRLPKKLFYLGPEGSFTHQAAVIAARQLNVAVSDSNLVANSGDMTDSCRAAKTRNTTNVSEASDVASAADTNNAEATCNSMNFGNSIDSGNAPNLGSTSDTPGFASVADVIGNRSSCSNMTDSGNLTNSGSANGADTIHDSDDAASANSDGSVITLVAADDVPHIIESVQKGSGWGVIAWENNVEGYVVPNLDALIDARDVAGFSRIGLDISFDAFARYEDPINLTDVNERFAQTTDAASAISVVSPSGIAPPPNAVVEQNIGLSSRVASSIHAVLPPNIASPSRNVPALNTSESSSAVRQSHTVPSSFVVSAHPHGLAQCKRFIAQYGLTAVPASSNAAACRDLQPGTLALGPSICGDLYGLRTLAANVQDYQGAHTEFLIIAPRDEVQEILGSAAQRPSGDESVAVSAENSESCNHEHDYDFESILTFIPLHTGPGVLADLLDVLRDAGLNMTSFMSRPIKGHDGTYSFIATIDAAPWQPALRGVLERIITQGDWVKTLAVYPRRERESPPVDAWMLPTGGVHRSVGTDDEKDAADMDMQDMRRELLW